MKATPTSELIEKYRKDVEKYQEMINTHNKEEWFQGEITRLNTLIFRTKSIITDLEQADKEWREKHRDAFKAGISFEFPLSDDEADYAYMEYLL